MQDLASVPGHRGPYCYIYLNAFRALKRKQSSHSIRCLLRVEVVKKKEYPLAMNESLQEKVKRMRTDVDTGLIVLALESLEDPGIGISSPCNTISALSLSTEI
jgi:hypothetical protein